MACCVKSEVHSMTQTRSIMAARHESDGNNYGEERKNRSSFLLDYSVQYFD